jgi:hypothetical protein
VVRIPRAYLVNKSVARNFFAMPQSYFTNFDTSYYVEILVTMILVSMCYSKLISVEIVNEKFLCAIVN